LAHGEEDIGGDYLLYPPVEIYDPTAPFMSGPWGLQLGANNYGWRLLTSLSRFLEKSLLDYKV